MISESGAVYKEQDPGLAVISESGAVYKEQDPGLALISESGVQITGPRDGCDI